MPEAVTLKRLTKRAEFLRVRAGARAARNSVIIEARRREADGAIGVGFTASRKVGGAVVRNRARRRLREAARMQMPIHGLPGVDYVLVARQSTPEADWSALLDDVGTALIRLASALKEGAASGSGRPAPRRPGAKPPFPSESE
jgi:ribonuclease P protein component